ncbi:hypothetical protein V2J09_017938 [Rumex salicifolius]
MNPSKQVRVDLYKNLSEAANEGNIDPASAGKRIMQWHSVNFFGYPDLFIIFTCNTKRPDITRFLKEQGLKPEDRPDIVYRVFKFKLNDMVKYIKKKKIFGEVKAGLPHTHILIFLHQKAKTFNVADIDNRTSVDILDPATSLALFRVVSDGAQNVKSLCMKGGRCTKYYPKEFVKITTFDDEGYPIYRRRNNCRTTESYYFALMLTLLLNGVIRLRQSRHDRISTSIYTVLDDIKEYFNCR